MPQQPAPALPLSALVERFPDDATAEQWIMSIRWPQGRRCAHCGSDRTYARANRTPQPYRCLTCLRYFSTRTGTMMHSSNHSFRVWAIAIHMMAGKRESISAFDLHRGLNISQRSAWQLAHKIREAFDGQRRHKGTAR